MFCELNVWCINFNISGFTQSMSSLIDINEFFPRKRTQEVFSLSSTLRAFVLTFSFFSHGTMDRSWWNQSGVLWTEILQGLFGNRDFQNLGHRSSGAIRCTCGVLHQLTAIRLWGGYMMGMQFLCSDGWASPGSPHRSDLSWVHLICFFWPVKHAFCFPHFTFDSVSGPFVCPTFW